MAHQIYEINPVGYAWNNHVISVPRDEWSAQYDTQDTRTSGWQLAIVANTWMKLETTANLNYL